MDAYTQIDEVKKIISDLRKESVKEFELLFESMLAMAKNANLDGMPVPRICQKQTARSNIAASSPKDYWWLTIFYSFS